VAPRTQFALPGLVGRSDIELVVVSNPETPDRTLAIKGLGPSPLPWLVESARLAEQMGAGDLAYPCNTAHYFLHRAPAELAPRVPLVDMIHETVAEVAASDLRRVGLLATTGTTSTRLYQEAFEAKAVSVVVPQHLGGAPSAIPVAWVEGWFFVDKKLRGYVPARSVYDNNTFMKVWLKE